MVVGYHLIWTAYGWWLPNDPRGSCSREIRVERIADLGELHHGRKPVQPGSGEIRRFYEAARDTLKHPLLTFDDAAIATIAEGFATAIRERQYTCYACAVMPDHVHLLIRRHRDKAKEMIAALQAASRAALVAAGLREPNHPVWGGPGWKVFLNTQADLERIVRYVHANPVKAGRLEQTWGFVSEYAGWLPRPVKQV